MADDWYEIMELPPEASPEDIKRQFRFLCQVWHPDRFSSSQHKARAEEKIKRINAANAVLSDPRKRANYDAGLASQRAWEQKQRQRQEEERRREDEQRRKRQEEEEEQKRQQQKQHRQRQEEGQRRKQEQQRQEEERKRREEQDRQRREEEARKDEWAREITYRAEIHPIFPEEFCSALLLGISPEVAELNAIYRRGTYVLSISPEGVAWGKRILTSLDSFIRGGGESGNHAVAWEKPWERQNFPLDSITRVRWGVSRLSLDGNEFELYTIAFGNDHAEAVVSFGNLAKVMVDACEYVGNLHINFGKRVNNHLGDKNKSIFVTFLDKLWRAVGVRLLGEMFVTLKSGRDLSFGDILVHDDGVTLVKQKFWGADRRVRCAWDQVHIWSENGLFYIGSRNDKKMYSKASYIEDANTHIIERAIRMALEKPGMRRLSDLLQ